VQRLRPDALIATRAIPFVMLAVALAVGAVSAQTEPPDPEPPETSELANFVYASQLGSGFYEVAGRRVWVLRFSGAARLRSVEDHGWGVRLRFPVTFGFYDFKPEDFLDVDLPDDVNTVTFVPGVEFEVPIFERWMLIPFVEFGAGKVVTSDGRWSLVYSGGTESKALFPVGRFNLLLGNELRYAGSAIVGGPVNDGWGRFKTVLEARHPLPFSITGKQARIGGYVLNNLYLDGLTFLKPNGDPVKIVTEYEIGVTFGTETPLKWWLVKLKGIGLGYRWGRRISAVRFFIGFPF